MKSVRRIVACTLGIFVVNFNAALAQGQGHGRGKERHGDDYDQGEHFYNDYDREVMGGWYDN